MKTVKVISVIMVATFLTICLINMSEAQTFHSGGVATCDGCHTMHNSSGNKAVAKKGGSTLFQGLASLLQGSDASSTCLICHANPDPLGSPQSYHVMTYPAPTAGSGIPPTERTPGGDFAWLLQNYSAKGSFGQTISSPGERHGHNVTALDYGLIADTTLLFAPGGSYANTALSYVSCHDPHGRARITDANGTIAYPAMGKAVLPIGGSGSYGTPLPDSNQAVGVYRLLAGANYSQMSYTNPLPFIYDPPVAVAPLAYNRIEATTETRVAYGKGMSEWCANCHRSIHNNGVNSSNTLLIHPAGNTALLTATANDLAGNASGTTIAAIYNAYKKSGDLTGTSATSYTSMVPYEEGITLIATLAGHADTTGTQISGPITGQENVMCLSCHRAHASGFNSISRWNNAAEFLTVAGAWPGTDVAVSIDYSNAMTQIQYRAAMYDRPAGNYAYTQRSLCNKCHAKD